MRAFLARSSWAGPQGRLCALAGGCLWISALRGVRACAPAACRDRCSLRWRCQLPCSPLMLAEIVWILVFALTRLVFLWFFAEENEQPG